MSYPDRIYQEKLAIASTVLLTLTNSLTSKAAVSAIFMLLNCPQSWILWGAVGQEVEGVAGLMVESLTSSFPHVKVSFIKTQFFINKINKTYIYFLTILLQPFITLTTLHICIFNYLFMSTVEHQMVGV